MSFQCLKQNCEIFIHLLRQCLTSETYCCGFSIKLTYRADTGDPNFIANCREIDASASESKKGKLNKKDFVWIKETLYKLRASIEEAIRGIYFGLENIGNLIENTSQNLLILQSEIVLEKVKSMISTGLELYNTIRCLRDLRIKAFSIRSNPNCALAEQDFRRTCSLHENNLYVSGTLLFQAYQEYVNDYHASTSLFSLIQKNCLSKKIYLFIYDTENETEEMKVLNKQSKHNYDYYCVFRVSNGILVSNVDNMSIIDRNYQIKMLPSKKPCLYRLSIYLNRSMYFFGGEDSNNDLTLSNRYDLDKNQWFQLASIHGKSKYSHIGAFNGNILISINDSKHLLHYSVDINSFSKIPYNFKKSTRKVLINTERMYLIESCNGDEQIYESDVGDVYTWQSLAKSSLTINWARFYWSYNKGAIYISTLSSRSIRNYYKFDLNEKVLIDIAYYGRRLSLKRVGKQLESIECYSKTSKFDLQNASLYNKNGYILSKLGRNLEKIEYSNENIKLYPERAYFGKADALRYLKKNLEAIKSLDEIIKFDPEQYRAIKDKGLSMHELGMNIEAIKFFSKADIWWIWWLNGNDYAAKRRTFHDLGLYHKEIKLLDIAHRRNYFSDEYFYLLKGKALLKLGLIFKAIKCFNKAIESYPNSIDAYFMKGGALRDLGKNEEAIDCFDNIIKLEPQESNAYMKKGHALHDLGRKNEAAECYDSAIKCGFNAKDYIDKKDYLSFDLDYFKLVTFELYSEALKINPNNIAALSNKEKTSYKLMMKLDAIETLNITLELDPKNVKAYRSKGNILHDLGLYREEITCYNEVLKHYPDDFNFFLKKRIALHNLCGYSKEIKCYDETIKLNSEEFDYYGYFFKKGNELYNFKVAECSSNNSDIFTYNKQNALNKLCDNLEKMKRYSKTLEIILSPSNLIKTFDNIERETEIIQVFKRTYNLMKDIKASYMNNLAQMEENINCDDKLFSIYFIELIFKHVQLQESAFEFEEKMQNLKNAASEDPDLFKDIDVKEKSIEIHMSQVFTFAYKNLVSNVENIIEKVQQEFYQLKLPADDHQNAMKLEYFDFIIKLEPEKSKHLIEKGYLMYDLGKKREAVECYNKAVKLGDDPKALISRKNFSDDVSYRLEKIEFCSEVLRINPNNISALRRKGKALYKMNRALDAIDCFNEILKIDPRNVDAYKIKGNILNNLGQYSEEIKCYNEALSLFPEVADFYFKKGNALHKFNRNWEAVEFYNKAIQLCPQNTVYYWNKGEALQNLRRFLEEIECYDKMIALDSECASAFNAKAYALHNLWKNSESIESLDKAIDLSPDGNIYYNKGKVLHLLNRNSEAISCYNEVIKLNPKDFDCYFQKGYALYDLGRNFEAIEYFDKASELDHNNIFAYNNKENSLYNLGRNLEVIENYSKTVKDCPFFNRKRALSNLGKEAEAMQDFNRAYNLMIEIQESSAESDGDSSSLNRHLAELIQKFVELHKIAIEFKEEIQNLKNAASEYPDLLKEIEEKEELIELQRSKVFVRAIDCLTSNDDKSIEEIQQEFLKLKREAAGHQNTTCEIISDLRSKYLHQLRDE